MGIFTTTATAASPAPTTPKSVKPSSANQVLRDVRAKGVDKPEPIDIHSTDGIAKMLQLHDAQIKALADYVDGKPAPVTVN